jgi:hypothetical protein
VNVHRFDAVDAVRKFKDADCLLLVWPNTQDANALRAFEGGKMIVVANSVNETNCTRKRSFVGSKAFWHDAAKNWRLVKALDLPRFRSDNGVAMPSIRCFCRNASS